MSFVSRKAYSKNELATWSSPNGWDFLAMVMIFTLIALVAFGANQMSDSYQLGDLIPISLEPQYLPGYALRTVIRMFIALFFSLIFTIILGAAAAKNRHAERLVIPAVDILQSVPVLSFLTITASGFIFLFKNSMLGPEGAAIFGIFTAQVWNMVLSFYQSLKTVPTELQEMAQVFQLSAWQKFWKLEVPFAAPGLLWNVMMSMSGSWFFVIACEAFSVSGTSITLPGVGSYIWLAIQQADQQAIIYAIITMLLVICLYDQLLFRPLVYWIEKFKEQLDDEEEAPRVWLISLLQKTRFLSSVQWYLGDLKDRLINLSWFTVKTKPVARASRKIPSFIFKTVWIGLLIALVAIFPIVWQKCLANLSMSEVKMVFLLGLFTGLRVMALIFIACLIWLPVGVWIGLRPRLSAVVQPIIQFMAAFPANLLFPLATLAIIKFRLNVEFWVAPLMVLGTQWYILFNVIAGTSQLNKELKLAAANFKVRGWLWWRRFVIPAIAPYFITGAITAAGGAWNASIIAEVITWGDSQLVATGIGAYIQQNSEAGDFARVALSTVIMCIIVLLINRVFWKPLYNIAMSRVIND